MSSQSKLRLPIFNYLRILAGTLAVYAMIALTGGYQTEAYALTKGTSSRGNVRVAYAGKTASPQTKFAQIRQVIQEYFKRNPHYREGNLIIRSEAQEVMQELEKKGYVVPDQESILNKTLSKSSFLAKVLRGNRQGQKFMHQISQYPLAYDQLDRLGRQPVGRRTVIDLAKGPDGYKMLQYMNSSRYGKNLGRMLSSDKAGGDYNKPTGKIYTAEQLTKAILEQLSGPKPKNPKR